VKARAERLAELLPDVEVDLMLVTDLVNVRYLTGYTGTSGLVLVGPQTRTFVTDFRYVEQAAEEVHPSFERRRAPEELVDAVRGALPDGPVRLGFEAAHTSVRAHARLLELLDGRAQLVGTTGLVERLRAVKEPEEIEHIRAAAMLADTAFERLISDGLVGRTERELAIALEFDMRRRGAERASFAPIIAAGPHGALPHAQPREVEIRRGELVVIDWGAELDGYCSDCTRTVAAGEPSGRAREIYELALEAQLAGLNAVKAGAEGRSVDRIARAVIDEGGHGDEFGHGLGHGVGLAVHEAPRLSQRSDDVLATGNVVTVEPGIYVPGALGVRIEDLVVVTDAGADVLTSVSKRLTVTD
jgi:Xaa-Pro aminopeptidase